MCTVLSLKCAVIGDLKKDKIHTVRYVGVVINMKMQCEAVK